MDLSGRWRTETVRSSRGESVGTASSPQRSSHIASVSLLSHQRSGWTTPGQASRACSPAAKPLYTAGEPTISFRHHGSHLHSLPPVPIEVEGGIFVGCLVGIEDNSTGGRAHGLTEQLGQPSINPESGFVEWSGKLPETGSGGIGLVGVGVSDLGGEELKQVPLGERAGLTDKSLQSLALPTTGDRKRWWAREEAAASGA